MIKKVKKTIPAKKKVSKKTPSGITKEMTMGEIIEKVPEAADVMLSYGLHCVGCFISSYETLEEGSLGHGLTPGDIDHMVREINALTPEEHPASIVQEGITMTERAIQQIQIFQKEKRKQGWPLQIEYVDLPNGEKEFFMEFVPRGLHHQHKIVFTPDISLLIAKDNIQELRGLLVDYEKGKTEEGFRFKKK
jgi:hybrid cluster-associated redox disulfide protein